MPTTADALGHGSKRATADFSAFDLGGNGDLDFEEFCKLVRKTEGELSDAALRKRFNELDKDRPPLNELLDPLVQVGHHVVASL